MDSSFAPVAQYGTGERGVGVDSNGCRRFKQPRGLHIAEDGSLFVADYSGHSVLKFKPGDGVGTVVAGKEGKILAEVDPLKDLDKRTPMGPAEGEGYLLKRPLAVCEGRDGGLFVMDTEDARVLNFGSTPGQKASPIMPAPGAPPGRSKHSAEVVKYPRSMFLHGDGTLVVCDTWSHRVLQFPAPDCPGASEPPLVIAGTPNSSGKSAQRLSFPSFAAFTASGALLVTDTNNHRVQCFQPGSASMGVTVAGSWKAQPGGALEELNMPTGICVDPSDDSFYVVDRGNARVLRFPAGSQSGSAGEIIAGSDLLERPWDVRLDADGCLYISDERLAVVFKLKRGASAAHVDLKRMSKVVDDDTRVASSGQEGSAGDDATSCASDAPQSARVPELATDAEPLATAAVAAAEDSPLQESEEGEDEAQASIRAPSGLRVSNDANELD